MRSDVVDVATRSRMMAGIKGKDTKPELAIRRELHRRGYRFRLHARKLPGKPDLVLRRFNAVIFVHGCFWHRHECQLFKWPKQRREFWRAKLNRNVERDAEAAAQLGSVGWRVLHIWECAIKGPGRIGAERASELASEWLHSGEAVGHITGVRSS